MATTLNIGSDATTPLDDTVVLDVPAGTTVTVNVIDGDTVNYYNNEPDDFGATGTIANGANQSFTAPAWLTSNSHSTVQITGGNY